MPHLLEEASEVGPGPPLHHAARSVSLPSASPWASRGSCGHDTSPPRRCGSAPCRTARLVAMARGRQVSRPCACILATATPTTLWTWAATSSPAANGVGCRRVTRAPPATSSPPPAAVLWAKRRDQHAVAARCAAAMEHIFIGNDKPLCRVEVFKWLGRVIGCDDSNVHAARR